LWHNEVLLESAMAWFLLHGRADDFDAHRRACFATPGTDRAQFFC
jgi:hypothetical protein